MLMLGMSVLAVGADTRTTAVDLMQAATADAAAQHKNVLVVFHASWCGWCRAFDAMLADKTVGPILNKYYVTTHVDVLERGDKMFLNTPGGDALMAKAGGRNAGLPFLAMFDAEGKPIVSSVRPVKKGAENIGYPNKPEEIQWFMVMIQRSAPGISSEESHAVETWLKKHAR